MAFRSPHPHRTYFPRPLTTVDVVLFTVLEEQLQVLLARRPETAGEPFPGRWALPGGFIDVEQDEDLMACARRKLFEKAGVRSPYLEQLGSWGDARRDPRGWSTTHVYFALVPAAMLNPVAGGNAAEVRWWPADQAFSRPGLAFDHARLLESAVQRLRSKVEYTSLPAFLLPEPFTLPQLQRIYEIVLDRPVNKSAFRTRMLAADWLQETGVLSVGSRRPPMGYRLKARELLVQFPRTFSPR